MIVLLDTGILLRLLDRSDPFHPSVRACKVRGDILAMAPQNIAEFWNVSTRPTSARGGLGLTIAETHKRLRLFERIIRIVPDSPNTYASWKQLVITLGVSGVQVHDARLASLMIATGVTHILTLNRSDFLRFSGITAWDPAMAISPPP